MSLTVQYTDNINKIIREFIMQFHEKYPDNNDEKLGGFQTFRMDSRCLFFPLSIPIKMYFCSGEFRRVWRGDVWKTNLSYCCHVLTLIVLQWRICVFIKTYSTKNDVNSNLRLTIETTLDPFTVTSVLLFCRAYWHWWNMTKHQLFHLPHLIICLLKLRSIITPKAH